MVRSNSRKKSIRNDLSFRLKVALSGISPEGDFRKFQSFKYISSILLVEKTEKQRIRFKMPYFNIKVSKITE